MRVIELLDKYSLSNESIKGVLQYASLVNNDVDKLLEYLNIDRTLEEEDKARVLANYLSTCVIDSPNYNDDNLMTLARYSSYKMDDDNKYKKEDVSGYDFDASNYESEDLMNMGYRR